MLVALKTSRRAAVLLSVLLLAPIVPTGLQAAEFGVNRGGPPPGYFMLVGPDAIQTGLTLAMGDIPHEMTFYIEVDSRSRLRIDIFDPGLYEPAGLINPQLDSSFSPTDAIGEMRITLLSPLLAQVIPPVSYFADDNGSNGNLVTLFNQMNMDPGTYQLVVQLMDTAETDEDVSVFGLSIPNHHVFSYNYCVGHNGQGGATISDPITLYPYVNYSHAAQEGPWPVCGLDLVNYDMDATDHGVSPPSMELITQRGYVFPAGDTPSPSANMSFWIDKLAEVPLAPLDSDDQGIWRWEFWDLGIIQDQISPSLPMPTNMDAFSMQVYDYGQLSPMFQDWPYQPSFLLPLDDRHPRRLYLPADDGSWPLKEHMGHSAIFIAGADPLEVGCQSTVEVTLQFTNPRDYDVTIDNGTTFVNPSTEFSDPVITDPGTDMTAVIDGGDPRQINISGTVPAGGTESFSYTLDIVPDSVGLKFITGDGGDFTGGASRQTLITYTTPVSLVYGPDRFGPICAIYFLADDPVCTAVADVVPSATTVCPGDPVSLDGTGSSVTLCLGNDIEYQWLADGNVIEPWSARDTLAVNPTVDTLYTLEVRSTTVPADCFDSMDVAISVYPAPTPAIDPPAPATCPGVGVTLTLTNPGAYLTYTWTTNPPGGPGHGTTDVPTVDALDIGMEYTVTGQTADGCIVINSVTIVEGTVAAPTFDPDPPRICQGLDVRIDAVGPYDRCVWTTTPPGAPGDGTDPDCFVVTNQPNVRYDVTVYDAAGCSTRDNITTEDIPDNVPPAMDNALRLIKDSPTDINHLWKDLVMTVGEYRIHRLDGDADFNGDLDTPPTETNIDLAPYWSIAPGLETSIEANATNTPSWLVYYKIRAASECWFTPGPL